MKTNRIDHAMRRAKKIKIDMTDMTKNIALEINQEAVPVPVPKKEKEQETQRKDRDHERALGKGIEKDTVQDLVQEGDHNTDTMKIEKKK